jgi:DNA-binding CsgD family transcriptional regulator
MIDFTEAAYDLESDEDDWIRNLLQVGGPTLDHGLGVFALSMVRPPTSGPLAIQRVHTVSGSANFNRGLDDLSATLGTHRLWPLSRPGVPKTLSEVTEDHDPAAFRAIMRHFDFARDALGLAAFERSGTGVYLIIALPQITTLAPRARERWQMLASHFGAGFRLRRAIEREALPTAEATGLPLGAEAVIDPADFRITDAAGLAKSRPAIQALREAAAQVDRARGELRESDPVKALEMWKALVRGRWSTVDWFDSGGRRYLLGIPNPPDALDPRGLTERETQVVSYVVFGLTNKMIAYHLGLSAGRISTLLSSAMKKLGVHTRAELVKRLTDFGSLTPR